MKNLKKIAVVLLALVMALSVASVAFAANTGKIYIDQPTEGQVYTIYKILDLESFDKASNAYSYKAAPAWSAFINSAAIKGVYVNVDTQGYVTWVEDADAAEFAKLAQAYAKANNIANQGSKEGTNATMCFENLELGYYLVDSTLGTLCALDTTDNVVTITEKNAEPTNDKTVHENSTNTYGKANDASLGEEVFFKSIITAEAGAENYVFHDTMEAGLTLTDYLAIDITHPDDPEAHTRLNKNVDYTVVNNPTDGCTFEVEFTKAFCDSLNPGDKIYVHYSAILNKDAVIGGAGNKNTSKVSYGDETKTTFTTPSITTTYTWSVDVFKYTTKDDTKVALKGAEFIVLGDSEEDNEQGEAQPIKVIYKKSAANKYEFVKYTEGMELTSDYIFTSDADGKILIEGLDAGTYALREIKAPAGYNKLANDVPFTVTRTVSDDGISMSAVEQTVEVENNSGVELPSTGGMGLTAFYAFGSIMLVGAAILLFTKKRMATAA